MNLFKCKHKAHNLKLTHIKKKTYNSFSTISANLVCKCGAKINIMNKKGGQSARRQTND